MKIVLIPCPIADQTASQVLPEEVRQAVLHTTHYLVENVRTARRFISELKLGIVIDELIFEILDKDTKRETIIQFFKTYQNVPSVGIISEAGCPGIADPGALAVGIAQEMNMEVVPLVGPSSILLALMASGFSGQQFRFHGYLPIERAARIRRIEKLQKDVEKTGETQLFIETPYRNNAMLEDLIQQLPANQLLSIGCNIQDPAGFTETKTLKSWSEDKPDLHKKPCIFLLGRS
ncbi:SAM-dependent methyltransferase [Aquirufa sp.]|jgi:16S rRNA (cytidine1402-2'-O)-methyltransferase|uniref:SAM-dependent methyltransferase n=1 Tax=Aquirufa sp. TaxID=2676249 RepID=UPI0037BF2DED